MQREKVGNYRFPKVNCGKRLVFAPIEGMNFATELGYLVLRPRLQQPNQTPMLWTKSTKVICVNIYDCFDKEDVMQIRQQLRDLGLTFKICLQI
jgi:hypothetical protein